MAYQIRVGTVKSDSSTFYHCRRLLQFAFRTFPGYDGSENNLLAFQLISCAKQQKQLKAELSNTGQSYEARARFVIRQHATHF